MKTFKLMFVFALCLWHPLLRVWEIARATYIDTSTVSPTQVYDHTETLDTKFGKRFSHTGVYILTSFVGILIEHCKLECIYRPSCVAIEYRVLPKFCSLLWNSTAVLTAAGYLTVSGFETLTNRSCGSANCNPGEACDSVHNNCSIKECGYPLVGTDVTGNQFKVGSKVVYNYSNNTQHTIICDGSGDWLDIVYIGTTCKNIKEIDPDTASGSYRNELNMTIVCDFDTAGEAWLVFQRRFDGSVNFYRRWDAYKSGFGDVNGEFWFGLENLHTILRSTSAQFELRIDLEDWDNNTRYAVYDNFYISDETDGYRLHVGTYSGTAGDSLHDVNEQHNGRMFSTKDRDNDRYEYSCSERFQGAWWYDDCFRASLNGEYVNGSLTDTFGEGLLWHAWKGFYYSLKSTSMKMRET